MNILFGALRKYWPLVLGATLITALIAGQDREQSFESRARLLLKLGDDFLQSGAGPDARVSGRIELADAINTDVQMLTSHDQYEHVVEALGVDSFRPEGGDPESFDAEAAIETLRRGLNVKSVENSAVIHLSYAHKEPARAKLVLSTLIDIYLRQRAEILGGGDASGVLENIRDETFGAYTAARDAHEDFLGGASKQDLEATLVLLREQLMKLSSDARDTRRQLIEDERQLAVIDTEIDRQPSRKEIFSEPRPNAALERAQNRLVELRVEEQQLLGKYTEGSRPVGRVRSEIAELQRIIRDETSAGNEAVRRTGNNPIRDQLEARKAELTVGIAGAEARLEALTEQTDELRSELLALERRYVRADRLHDALTVAESRYREVDQQYFQHRIWSDNAIARATNVRLIERPILPLAATGLPASVRYLLGALLGFLVSSMIVVWIELLRQRERYSSGVPTRRFDDSADVGELGYAHRGPEGLAERRPRYLEATLPVLGEFRSVEAGEGR